MAVELQSATGYRWRQSGDIAVDRPHYETHTRDVVQNQHWNLARRARRHHVSEDFEFWDGSANVMLITEAKYGAIDVAVASYLIHTGPGLAAAVDMRFAAYVGSSINGASLIYAVYDDAAALVGSATRTVNAAAWINTLWKSDSTAAVPLDPSEYYEVVVFINPVNVGATVSLYRHEVFEEEITATADLP